MVYAFFVEMKVISSICIAVLTVQVSTRINLKHDVYNPKFMLRVKKILTRNKGIYIFCDIIYLH